MRDCVRIHETEHIAASRLDPAIPGGAGVGPLGKMNHFYIGEIRPDVLSGSIVGRINNGYVELGIGILRACLALPSRIGWMVPAIVSLDL